MKTNWSTPFVSQLQDAYLIPIQITPWNHMAHSNISAIIVNITLTQATQVGCDVIAISNSQQHKSTNSSATFKARNQSSKTLNNDNQYAIATQSTHGRWFKLIPPELKKNMAHSKKKKKKKKTGMAVAGALAPWCLAGRRSVELWALVRDRGLGGVQVAWPWNNEQWLLRPAWPWAFSTGPGRNFRTWQSRKLLQCWQCSAGIYHPLWPQSKTS